jgi:hypothetical protein
LPDAPLHPCVPWQEAGIRGVECQNDGGALSDPVFEDGGLTGLEAGNNAGAGGAKFEDEACHFAAVEQPGHVVRELKVNGLGAKQALKG